MRYFAYRAKYRWGKHLPLRTPVDVSLELSSACNMKCSYCYHADPKSLPFKREIMPVEIAKEAIRQCAEMGVHSMKFNYRGEATQNPNFSEIVKYAGSFDFDDLILNSNFKFKNDRDDIFDAMTSLTKVKVSYDSFIKDVFEAQRRGGNHALTTANIERFYNYKDRKDTTLVIQAVRTKLNKDEDIRGEAQRRWPGVEVSIRDMVTGRVDADLSDFEHRTRPEARQPCLQAFVRLIVNANGSVQTCCPDIANKLLVGQFPDDSLKQIFNGEYAKKLRRDLKSGEAFKKTPCLTCPSYESFKGYKHPWKS